MRQNRNCALCRASIPDSFDAVAGPLHRPIEQMLMRHCTVEYMQRVEDVALEAAHLVRLRIGNKYDFLGCNPRPKHQWTVEVDLEAQPDACLPRGAELPDLIKSVRFGLLPACRLLSYGSSEASETEKKQAPPRYVEVACAPFQVTATSPTSCTIPLIITWQDWLGQPPLRLEHVLDFCHDGGCWDYGVDLHAALTGSTLEDVSQAQSSQQQSTMNNSAGEGAPFDAAGSPQETADLSENQQNLCGARLEAQIPRRKRAGVLSMGWNEMCRHLPKMRMTVRRRV